MKLRLHVLAVSFTTLLTAAALHAQTATPAADPAPIDDKVIRLEKVEVTAAAATEETIATDASGGTKTDTPLIETPQSISVITRDEMDLRNVKGVAEALRYTAGVSTETYGEDPRGYDWVTIRGFDAFNSQYLDGLHLFSYELTEAFGIEQVEVLKGPSSVLYGQSTPGGLINSVSKRPTATQFGELTAELGTHESYETTLDLGGPVTASGTVLYRLSALFHDHEEDDNGFPVNARRTFIAPAATFKLSDATTLTILTGFFHGESTQIPTRAAGPTGENTGVYMNNETFDYEENTIYRLGYQLEHHVTPDLTLRQNARVSRYDVEDRYLSIDTSVFPDGYSTPTTLDRYAERLAGVSKTFAIDNQAELKLTGEKLDQTILAGLDFGFSDNHTRAWDGAAPSLDISAPNYRDPVTTPTFLVYDNDTRNTQAGLYAQDQLKLEKHWIATLSARYDWADSSSEDQLPGGITTKQKDQALSGRVGLLYLADNGLSPYVSYSTSFYPNSGSDFAGTPFDPSEGKQYEVGLKYAPKGVRGIATLSIYQLTQSNVLTDDLANPGFSLQTGEVRSRGIEFESKLGLTESLDLLLGATTSQVQITKSNAGDQGNVPALTPETIASAWLDYTLRDGALRGLTFGGGLRYTGGTYSDNFNTHRNASTFQTDLALRYIRGSWHYALNVNNVFNKVVDFADGYGGYDQNGARSIHASVAYHW